MSRFARGANPCLENENLPHAENDTSDSFIFVYEDNMNSNSTYTKGAKRVQKFFAITSKFYFYGFYNTMNTN